MALGALLRDGRRRLGLTQAEVASSSGISREYLSTIEAGLRTPRASALLRLAERLELSADPLLLLTRKTSATSSRLLIQAALGVTDVTDEEVSMLAETLASARSGPNVADAAREP